MTKREHRALITWSDELVARGLPAIRETVDPIQFRDSYGDGWSLRCRFDKPPNEQGNPSEARVSFLMDNAPHEHLRTGARFPLFERFTGRWIVVEILD